MTQDPTNQIPPFDFERNSQIAHMASTFGLCLTAWLFWGCIGYLVAAIGCALYATWHEGWYDTHFENPITRGSGWVDWGFLVGGVVLAGGVAWLRTVTR